MNVVMTGKGGIVEIQGTAEGAFTRQQMNTLEIRRSRYSTIGRGAGKRLSFVSEPDENLPLASNNAIEITSLALLRRL